MEPKIIFFVDFNYFKYKFIFNYLEKIANDFHCKLKFREVYESKLIRFTYSGSRDNLAEFAKALILTTLRIDRNRNETVDICPFFDINLIIN